MREVWGREVTPRPSHISTLVEPVQTRRPAPSRPEVSDEVQLLGQLLASQTKLERAWEARAVEYETFARDVTQLRKEVEELTSLTKKTQALLKKFAKVGPALLALAELARTLLQASGKHP